MFLSGQGTTAQAQTYAQPQVIKVSKKSSRRYWVRPPSAYYKRYIRKRAPRNAHTQPRYSKQYKARKLREYRRQLREYRRRMRDYRRAREYRRSRDYRRAREQQRLRKYRKTRQNALRKKTRRTVRKVAKATPWKTEGLPKGPVQLVVSIADQRMTVYKGGEKVVTTPVSTGKPGYDTPSGIFSILQKRRVHFSRKYDNAPMPNMQRLTWSGIALHGGRVPGYPASHGCIRLPYSFAKKLFGFTKPGNQVIVAQGNATPVAISHEVLPQPVTLAGIVGRTPDLGLRSDGRPGMSTMSGGTQVAALDTTITDSPVADVAADSFSLARARAASEVLADIEHTFARVEAFKARSDAPLRVAVTQWTARERIVAIQRLLDELGHDPGPADGKAGPRTVAAIKAFEKASDLPVTGMVTDTLVAKLASATGRPSVPNGHLYVRQNGKPLFDVPVTLEDGPSRLGTHIFTALQFPADAEKTTWTAMTLNATSGDDDAAAPVATPAEALDRLSMPPHVRQRLSDLLTPGSTMIITDNGISNETNRGTDLIVEVN